MYGWDTRLVIAGTVMLANRAYPQAAVMWIFITPLLYKFARFCDLRYANAIRHMPLEVAVSQPRALVPVGMYIPPAMRDGCEGWHPEIGKVRPYALSFFPSIFSSSCLVPAVGQADLVSYARLTRTA